MSESVKDRARSMDASLKSTLTVPNSNPYAETWDSIAGRTNYGRPPPGSLTEARGIKAHEHVMKEINECCEIIRDYGKEVNDGWIITFHHIFSIYVAISDKVVGLLLRARKHGLVDFEGEMLFQGRDDNKIIKFLKIPRTPMSSPSPSPRPSPRVSPDRRSPV